MTENNQTKQKPIKEVRNMAKNFGRGPGKGQQDMDTCPQCGKPKQKRYPLCFDCSRKPGASQAGKQDQPEIEIFPTGGTTAEFLVKTYNSKRQAVSLPFICATEGKGVDTHTTSDGSDPQGWPVGTTVITTGYEAHPQKVDFFVVGRQMPPISFSVPANSGAPTLIVDTKKEDKTVSAQLSSYEIEVDIVAGGVDVQILVQTYKGGEQVEVPFMWVVDNGKYKSEKTSDGSKDDKDPKGARILTLKYSSKSRKAKFHVIGGKADTRDYDIPTRWPKPPEFKPTETNYNKSPFENLFGR